METITTHLIRETERRILGESIPASSSPSDY